MYRHSQDQLVQTLGSLLPAPINWTDKSASAAVFGEVSRRLLDDKLELTGGVRVFHDEVTNQENVQGQNKPNVPLYHRDSTFNSTTPRVVATWFPVSDTTVYASYSQGFRSGFAQNANVFVAAPGIPAVKPDKLSNYELGAKGSLWGHAVYFDAAVYYIDWKDIQQTLLVQLPNNVQTSAVVNGRSASGVGFDYGLTVRPVEGLSIRGSVGWNDLSLDSDVYSGGVLLFHKGDRPNESAQTTTSLSTQYEFGLGGTGYKAVLSATGTYHSKLQSRTIASKALIQASSDSIFDNQLELSVKSPEHWTTTLFASNVSNRFGITDNAAGSATLGTVRQRPRVIGLQFEYHY
jgi:outer membrane receptor protein involved in Fe transport